MFCRQSDGEFSDEDDQSWKVRRAASRTLAAIIFTRGELLSDLLKTTAPILVSRFTEREENVRLENFNTFITLLKRVESVHKTHSGDAMETSDGSFPLLKELVPKVAKSITKALKDKSQKTKLMGFTILKDLVIVLGGGLENNISTFGQPVATTLSHMSSNSPLKIECLSFLASLFRYHQAPAFASILKTIVPSIVKATTDKYYKVASEALHTCSELVQALRPIAPQVSTPTPDFVVVISQVYTADVAILGLNEVDQEVKEKALYCLGHIIGHAADVLPAETGKGLTLLLEKISNEVTRLVGVKTLNFVARSPLQVNLGAILGNAVTELSTFLRKTNRSLKLSSIICLNTIVSSYPFLFLLHPLVDSLTLNHLSLLLPPDRRGKEVPEKQLAAVVVEVKAQINDSDLQILPLAFNLLTQILQVNKGTLSVIKTEAFPPIFVIIKSPLLQGTSLRSLLDFLGTAVAIDGALFASLLTSLLEPLTSADQPLSLSSSKQPFASIAQSVAVICHASPANISATAQKFIALIKKANATDSEKYLGLLTLGEIGKLK